MEEMSAWLRTETEQNSWRVQSTSLFCVPCCLLGIRFIQPPWPLSSLSSIGQLQTLANQGREGKGKTGKGQSRVVQSWGRVPIPSQVAPITVSLSSAGTKAFNQKEDNFRLSARFLEHHPVTSPPANQKKAIPLAVLTPNSAFCSWVRLKSSF